MDISFDLLKKDREGFYNLAKGYSLSMTKTELINRFTDRIIQSEDKLVSVCFGDNRHYNNIKEFVERQHQQKKTNSPILISYKDYDFFSKVRLINNGVRGLHDFLKGRITEIKVERIYDYGEMFTSYDEIVSADLYDLLLNGNKRKDEIFEMFSFDIISGKFKLNTEDGKRDIDSLEDIFSKISFDPLKP